MFSPLLKGDIHIDPRGVAFCSGECEIGTTEILNTDSLTTAFSFEFCSLNLNKQPNISFGIKQSETIVLTLDYFGLLRTIRSITVTPHIPSDGLGVSIHLLVSENEISLYINEVLQTQKYTLDTSSFSFFLSFNSVSAVILTPFSTIDLPKTFFPDLNPHLWAQLPCRVSLRGFNIKSASDSSRNIFGEEELKYLPGLSKTRYFEVIYRSVTTSNDNSSSGIGLVEQPRASCDMPPGYGFHSIGFFIEDKSLYVNSSNEFTISGKEKIKSGSVIGIGIHSSGGIFVTFNGKRANQSLISIPSFQKYFPVITTNGICDELIINLGELPFSYREISPPFGWTLYTPPTPDSLFSKGPPNESHLLHFFPFTCHTQRHADCFIASFQLPDGGRFESTILKMKGDDIIAIGFSDQNFNVGDMVGWSQKSIGVHSDDGNCFFEDVNNPKKVCDQRLVGEGKTIGIGLSQKKITYTIDTSQYLVVSDFANPTYPTITVEGPIAIIVNFGESPFAGEQHENCQDGVKLFNGRRVKMTNEKLELFGLAVGDEVECRDLSFRGHFAGELNGRPYFNVNGIDGAVPLDTCDPVLVARLVRVTRRKSDAPFLQPLLTFDSVVLNNVAYREKPRLFASPYGLAVLCGHCHTGGEEAGAKARQDSSAPPAPSSFQSADASQKSKENESSNVSQIADGLQSTDASQKSKENQNSNDIQNTNTSPVSNSLQNTDASQICNASQNSNAFQFSAFIQNSRSSFTSAANPFSCPAPGDIHKQSSCFVTAQNPFNNLGSAPLSPLSPPSFSPPRATLRPVFDLMNSSPCFTSSASFVSVLDANRISPTFKTSGVKFLDVVCDADRSVLLMLGSQGGVDVGWNNSCIVPLKGKPKIVFRFFGFALKKLQNRSPVLVNVGNRRGGELFPPNYHGTNGAAFYQHSTSQKSFGSSGFALVPPIVQQLVCSLNERFCAGLAECAAVGGGDVDIGEIIYATNTHVATFYGKDDQEKVNEEGQIEERSSFSVNLITETNYMKLK